ncbi:hypothetical protein AK830_g1620 [Neonectria ditissima]|uniref:Uncharacterized protein n=1 Tax=Neonectria ditissima TaxID=78410 RepID=A0A0P7BYR1_9HYPO|nr:hypothetical protein AK830_g1620 [Neonectria ditissima]
MASTTSTPLSTPHHKLFSIDRRPLQPSDYFDIKDQATGGSYYMELNDDNKAIRPDLVLHTGSSVHGPVVGICNLAIGGHMKIGLGDLEGRRPMKWEYMTRRNLRTSIFSWETDFAWPTTDEHAEKRVLWWKRTRSVNVEGGASTFLRRNWKLVDEASDEILAVCASSREIGHFAMLEIRVQLGDVFEQMAILTCLSLYEEADRD